MHFLDRLNSWNLLCEIVFGEEACCPQELIETGRRIAENCKGLPLSITVIGGLLAKSRQTARYWQDVAENFDSIVNLENSEYCLRILYMSYDSLPVHLKPCFLYTGIFGENTHIHVSNLIKLWDAEGFLKPDPGRSLEEVADKYLGELVDRNLILVEKRNYNGKLISCRIHNLLRDLCLREARKQKFFFIAGVHSLQIPRDILSERCICIQERRSIDLADNFDELRSSAVARSLMWEHEQPNLPTVFRLLRVYAADATIGSLPLLEILKLKYDSFIGSEWKTVEGQFLSLKLLVIERCHELETWITEKTHFPRLKHLVLRGLQELKEIPSDIGNIDTLKSIELVDCSDSSVNSAEEIRDEQESYGNEDLQVHIPSEKEV
ncbi:putative late blight resistance protein homolog R1A-10 [Salvia hispanica]|uniref:putative late blight resistance protein homolog R1A-10 n=1 Tax=Salvia hispanica TaxID=49212 RepID=UPI00200904FD|nr:putative late blight resistance protein homolog R1A-10 [Salvia hispanica]